jgi:hypothetical protein
MRLKRILVLGGGGGGAGSAASTSYDNGVSGLVADDVQEALDEIAAAAGLTPSGVDPATNTLAELAAIVTLTLTVPVVKIMYNSTSLEVQTWVLLAGTDATNSGVTQRPDDYAGTTNEKVWYRS